LQPLDPRDIHACKHLWTVQSLQTCAREAWLSNECVFKSLTTTGMNREEVEVYVEGTFRQLNAGGRLYSKADAVACCVV
jgi:hypothetical protein